MRVEKIETKLSRSNLLKQEAKSNFIAFYDLSKITDTDTLLTTNNEVHKKHHQFVSSSETNILNSNIINNNQMSNYNSNSNNNNNNITAATVAALENLTNNSNLHETKRKLKFEFNFEKKKISDTSNHNGCSNNSARSIKSASAILFGANGCFLTKNLNELLVKSERVLLPERRPFTTKTLHSNPNSFTSRTMINMSEINKKFLNHHPKRIPNPNNKQNLEQQQQQTLSANNLNIRNKFEKEARNLKKENVKIKKEREQQQQEGVLHKSKVIMARLDNNEDYRKSPVDLEYLAYVKHKKELKDKLHDHWKLELNTNNNNSIQKGKSLNKINDEMYKEDQQWLTIVNLSSNQSKLDEAFTRDGEKNNQVSLIDTFTANLDNNNEKLDSYQVNSEVGTLIAQKMFKGEKIRVGRNGASVNTENHDTIVPTQGKRDSLSKLFEELEVPSGSVLSWKDQVEKANVKIIEAKIQAPNLEKKLKPERNLIVKKLTDEDEFKPKSKKSPLEMISLNQLKQYQHNLPQPLKQQLAQPAQTSQPERIKSSSVKSFKVPVEVIGTNSLHTNPFQQHMANSSRNDNKAEFSLESTTAQFLPATTKASVVLSLSEKNYLQIIDNLTSRYGSANAERPKPNHTIETSSPLLNPANNNKVTKLNENSSTANDLLSFEFSHDLGISVEEHLASASSRLSQKNLRLKKKLKLLEKKYSNLNLNNNNNKEAALNFNNTNSAFSMSSNSLTQINNELSLNKNEHTLNLKSNRNYLNSNSNMSLLVNNNGENLQSKLQSLGGGYYYTTITNAALKSLPSQHLAKMRQSRDFKVTNDRKYVQLVKPLSPVFRQAPTLTFQKKIYNLNLDDDLDLAKQETNSLPLLIPSTPTQSTSRLNLN